MTQERRGTVMTEFTAQTENFMEYEHSSDEFGEDDCPPWVDKVKLRHGMDWLDLIKNEVVRDTAKVDNSLRRTGDTARTE